MVRDELGLDAEKKRYKFTFNTAKPRHEQAYQYLLNSPVKRGDLIADALLLHAAISEIYPAKREFDRFFSALETYRLFVANSRQSIAGAMDINDKLESKVAPKRPNVGSSTDVNVVREAEKSSAADIVVQPDGKMTAMPDVRATVQAAPVDVGAADVKAEPADVAEVPAVKPIAPRRLKEVPTDDAGGDDPLFSALMEQMRRNGIEFDPRTAQMLQEDLPDFEEEDIYS